VKIVAGFHIRDDAWILHRKLRSLAFCDHVVVLSDRAPGDVLSICAEYPNVVVHQHTNTLGLPDLGPDGPLCEEGIMRQKTWDLMAEYHPDWVLLGDADETITPDIIPFLADGPTGNVYYLDWVNLFKDKWHQIVGPHCIWSYEHKGSNKKGAIIRFSAAAGGYNLGKYRHTRLEPNPISQKKHIEDDKHRWIQAPKLLHWKFTNWPRWDATLQSKTDKYVLYWRGIVLEDTPEEWLWE